MRSSCIWKLLEVCVLMDLILKQGPSYLIGFWPYLFHSLS